MPDREILESIRHRMEHEDNLMNQRLSWLLTSQSFLLTGYAILLNGPTNLRAASYARDHEILVKAFPAAGIATILLLWLSIWAAMRGVHELRSYALSQPRIAANYVQRKPLTRFLGSAAPILVPPVFLVTWLALLLR